MKIALLGDSITEGIGSKKINYSGFLHDFIIQEVKNLEIRNFAKSGTTIEYITTIINDILEFKPDIVVMMYGNVDAQRRPNIDKNRFRLKDITPYKYKTIGGMLDPRALYSKSKIKKIPQYMDNLYRFIWKRIMILTQGTYQKLDINQFSIYYEDILKRFSSIGCKMICLSTVYIDDRYFINSTHEYELYNHKIKQLSTLYGFEYVDIFSILKENVDKFNWNYIYYNDHFHPNERGLMIIAKSIFSKIHLIIKSKKSGINNEKNIF